ncbi:MAG TPA: DUF4433 domain-containing protein [Arcobacter sp.]|nr:DUF4433 domain-containing protein [Arcobacter sp.]
MVVLSNFFKNSKYSYFKSLKIDTTNEDYLNTRIDNEDVDMIIESSTKSDSTKEINSLWDDKKINDSPTNDFIGGDYNNKEFNEQDVAIAIQFSVMNNNEWELLHANLDKTKQFLISSGWVEKDNFLFVWTEVNDENKYKYIQLDSDSNNFPVLRAGFMKDIENLEESPKPLDSLIIDFDDEVAFNNIVQSITESLEEIIVGRSDIALEFILYELGGLVLDENVGKKFVDNSGFEVSDYIGHVTESDEADMLFDVFLEERSNVATPGTELFISLSIAVLDYIMQKYSLGNYQQSKENKEDYYVAEGHLKKNEQYYKELYSNIPIFLKSKDIDGFYHFTDVENLKSIIDNGGLYSWYGLEKKGISTSLSSDDLSRQLDAQKNLENYIRLSFADYHPMSTKAEKKYGKKLIWLEIDLDVALWENTLFTDINATDNNVKVGSNFDFLKTLDFDIFKQKYSNLDSLEKKKYQAEIMVKDFLPIKYIKNMDSLKEKYLEYEEIPF